jgi:hypothetical protein
MVSSFSRAFRPTALAFRARSARSASLNRMRLPRRRSFSSRFSACRYSMTISCCRWTQPDTTINRNVRSGGMEPMPKVYRRCRSNIWTLRVDDCCRSSRRRPPLHFSSLTMLRCLSLVHSTCIDSTASIQPLFLIQPSCLLSKTKTEARAYIRHISSVGRRQGPN